MKKSTSLFIIFAIFCLMHELARSQINSTPAVIAPGANDVPYPYDRFVKHGELAYDHTTFNSVEYGAYFYKNQSGKWVLLQNDIGNINNFFKDEINSKEEVTEFMHEWLARFLVSTMTSTASVIMDKNSAQADWGITPEPGTPQPSPKVQEQLRVKFRSYVASTDPVLAGNRWTLSFCVLTMRGGVEHWLIVGSLGPFQISSFKREVAEIDDTFYPTVMAQ